MEAILKLISANLWGKKHFLPLKLVKPLLKLTFVQVCLWREYFFKDEGIPLHVRDLKMRLFLLKIRIFLKIRSILF